MVVKKFSKMVERSSIQGMQDTFARAMHLACRVFFDGKPVSEGSGSVETLHYIRKYVDLEKLQLDPRPQKFFELEEVSTKTDDFGPVRMRAITIRSTDFDVTWVLFGIIREREPELSTVETLSEADFDAATDLICQVTRENLSVEERAVERVRAEKELTREDHSGESRLEKLEIINRILLMAETEDDTEKVISSSLEAAARFLHISEARLYRTNREEDRMELIHSWPQREEEEAFRELLSDQPFKIENTYMISYDTPVPENCKEYLDERGLHAMMRFPIKDKDQVIFILELREYAPERIWALEEIKFAGELRDILQRTMEQRISRHSLTASYLSMKHMLDHVDFGLTVIDSKDKHVLFTNSYFRKLFEREGILNPNDLIYICAQADDKPIYIERVKAWVHFHKYNMEWVDGRDAILLEAHDIEYRDEEDKNESVPNELDVITGLYNGRKCQRDFVEVFQKCKETGGKGALICMDIDDFKQINSRFGMQRGDELLMGLARRLMKMDEVGGQVYRLRSDEFYILIGPEQYEHMDEILESIRNVFTKPWTVANMQLEITASVGVVEFPSYGDNMRDIEAKVEVAMYQAKTNGKKQVAFYNDELAGMYRRKVDMEMELKQVVRDECKELEVYYQPIMDVTGEMPKCVGAEALVRWNSKKFGLVSPAVFIPLAEEHGLISTIGEFVLREACQTCRYWNDFGHPEFRVNVNFSVIQLMQMDIEEIVKKYLYRSRLNPSNLVVEMTESVEVENTRRMNEILDGLHELGCRVALDDFGTGYASMSHVRELSVDIIKVDQCFVTDILDDKYADTFVKMVVELAAVMHVDVCVEGVETAEQYQLLKEKQVRSIQGYYFSKPIPREEFERKYMQ